MKKNTLIKTATALFVLVMLLSSCIAPDSAKVSEPELKNKQTDKPAIVFLVAGQSNAGGCGVVSTEVHEKLGRHKKRPLVSGSTAEEVGLPVDAADYTHSYMWVPKQGFQRTDPKTNTRPMEMNGNWHGMELPVIRELEKRFPENDIYVIKYGSGGTNLHHQWNPERNDGLYATWLGYYRKAMAQLIKKYPQVRVAGLYWDQGESDGIDKKHAEYAKNLEEFITAVRRDTGLPQLKVFIRKHIFNWPNIDAIIAAQEKVAKDDSRCYLLDIDLGNRKANYQAWAYSPGNGHISSKGFVELTKRLFDGPLRNATVESFDNYAAAKSEAEAKDSKAAKVSKLSKQTDTLAKISYENVKHLRYPKPQKTPDWARKVFEEKIRVLKERAVRNYEKTGRWYYVKYDNGDCGKTVWWDEVASDRVYVQLQGLLGGIEKLPNYSPENHRKAIEFWQSWQNEITGVFNNPFFVDPRNPNSKCNTDGYNRRQYRGVNQKYLPGILAALGSASLYEVAEDRKLAEPDVASSVRDIEKALKGGTRGQYIGNQVTRQIWVMADHIDRGKTELIPDYERLMTLLLRRFDAKTGLLGRPNFRDYNTSANNVKCNARIIGYVGLENYPYRKALADSLANAFSKSGVGNSGAVRNWSYLSTLALQQTDHRSDDLYKAIETLVKGFAKGSNPGYTWMALSTATAWLNWDTASCQAFKDPSVALCYNGVNRPYRSVVGPFGRWVNVIPRKPEETYGNPGFSWDKYSLRARNTDHEKRKVIDIVPAAESWNQTTDEQGRLTLKRTFTLDHAKLQNPYLKAQWNGHIEIYLNDVLVKKVSGNFPEYCGLHVPQVACKMLKPGENTLVVRTVGKADALDVSVGLIDWRLPQECNNIPKTTIITYPAPESETESKVFSMTVNRKPVFVSQVRVSADPINQVWPGHQRPKEQTEMASFAYFDCEGVISIEIESKRPIETITIRPKSAGISHLLKGNKITISLDQPRKFVIEVNGRRHAMHVFANATEKDKPNAGDPNVRYFGPGVHRPGVMQMKSGETIYIAGGAVVYGAIDAMNVSDVRILGRGILDAGKLRRFSRKDHQANSTVAIGGSKNIAVGGIICRNSFKWTIVASRSSYVSVSDVKLIGMWRYNADGIDVVNSENVTIDNCFIRAFDDCICIKGSEKPDGWKIPPSKENRDVKDIHVRNCIIWNDWGIAFKIGTETIADSITNYTVENCDIIHFVHCVFAIYSGNQALISNLKFKNIRIEDIIVENFRREDKDERYKPEGRGKLVYFNFHKSLWNEREGRNYENCGGINNVQFKDISYSGKHDVTSNLIGANKNRKINNILFSNVILQGKHVLSLKDAKMGTNEFVENIRFE